MCLPQLCPICVSPKDINLTHLLRILYWKWSSSSSSRYIITLIGFFLTHFQVLPCNLALPTHAQGFVDFYGRVPKKLHFLMKSKRFVTGHSCHSPFDLLICFLSSAVCTLSISLRFLKLYCKRVPARVGSHP